MFSKKKSKNTDRCQATTATGFRRAGKRAQHATNHGTRNGAAQDRTRRWAFPHCATDCSAGKPMSAMGSPNPQACTPHPQSVCSGPQPHAPRTGGRGRKSAQIRTALAKPGGIPLGRPPTTCPAHNASSQEHALWGRPQSAQRTGAADPDCLPERRKAGGAESQTPDAPHNGEPPPLPQETSCHPRGTQCPAEHASQGASAGSPRLHNRTHSMWAADPDFLLQRRAAGEGQCLTSDTPQDS